MNVNLTARYYEQFDADFDLEVPAESLGGWKEATVEIACEHTALVVMHAWDFGRYSDCPGWHRAVEYIPRAKEICRTVFPPLLTAVRSSEIALFHVVESGNYYKEYRGFLRAKALTKRTQTKPPQVLPDPALVKLRNLKKEPGHHNSHDIKRAFANLDFAPEARPRGDEGVAEDGDQLLALCQNHEINHLIYVGFAINWCLLLSPGGMAEMRSHGLLCSTLRQAVTAVENKETARRQLAKELALWRIAVDFGFVFDADELIRVLGNIPT